MDGTPDRKLTTLLSADVAGYSRLMGADEPGTLARLKACRETIQTRIAEHRGRLVNTAGDSVLAEFASVVHAVDCAVRIQRDLAERNATLPEGERMRFRIGVNLGDVMVDGGDLFGEGVNIAARLQELAEPGGVLVSGSVFEQVRNKLSVGFDFLGAQAVKNIAEAVPAYRVVLGGEAAERAGVEGKAQRPVAVAAPPAKGAAAALGLAVPAGPAEDDTTRRLKRLAAVSAIAIVVVFAVNVLTWEGRAWFVWPTLGILAWLALRWAMMRWR
jgi:adenylate cyclase